VFETSGGTDISIAGLESGDIKGSVPGFSYDSGYAAVQGIVDAAGAETVEPALAER
jgi:hypothetical protein